MISTEEKEKIISYFPEPPIHVYEIGGIDIGIIIKFESFYLKIYHDTDKTLNNPSVYLVQMHRYNTNQTASVYKVPENGMRKFISEKYQNWKWNYDPMYVTSNNE